MLTSTCPGCKYPAFDGHVLPPVGEQVRPDQERTRDVEHQRTGRHPPGSRHRGGCPLPLHVHCHHPHRHEAAEAHVGLGLRSVPPVPAGECFKDYFLIYSRTNEC